MVSTGLAVTSMDEFLTTIKEAQVIMRIPQTGSHQAAQRSRMGDLVGEIKTHGK